MKLRIQGDTLRLRLSRTDLATLDQTGAVEAVLHAAPGAALRYALRVADVPHLGATVDGAAVTVLLPRPWAAGWAGDARVGFEGTQDAGDGRTLAILVEKDFDCLHRRPHETDLFPHPDADAG